MTDEPEFVQREPRYRYFIIETAALMTLLGGWRGHETVCLPIVKGLPDGTFINGVHYDFSRDGFIIRFYHESFKPILPGCHPMIETWEHEAVTIQTNAVSQ